ncbi:NEW3 domain-containing protein [Lentzea sp. HUAS TT2]|uniref:NEW3 domain-containing protein n=1 Tax=Lentzea sp. HUAS TT2 TaxID=3447454 RepID=UPI003F72DE92
MIAAESTELFVGPRTALLQVVRLSSPEQAGPVHAHVSGPGLHSPRHGGSLVLGPFGYELGVDVSAHSPGAVVPAQAVVRSAAGEETCTFSLVVGSPGWTVHLVGHVAGDAPFDVVRAHLDLALTDPAYRFAVTSVELLQPYWDMFPEHRSVLLRLISEGRVEVVGSESNVVGVAPLLASLPAGPSLVASSLAEAERSVYSSFLEMRAGTSSPHVMMPVGSARDAPNPWLTAIHHDWSARYTWPRIFCSLPRDYYVRGSVPVPPAPLDDSPAALFASHAARLTGAAFPSAALERAALAHPREAFDLRSEVVARSLAALTSTVDSSVTVWNPSSSPCTDIVSVHLPEALNVHVEFDGVVLPTLVDGVTVTFLARDVPARGWRTYSLVEDDVDHGWKRGYGTEIASTHYVLSYDPIASLVAVDGPALEAPRLIGPISVWHSEVGEKMVGSTTITLWHEVGHLGPSSLFAVLGSRSPASGTLPSVAPRLSLAGPPLGPVSPEAPVFARYWLHEPAPLGGLPANVRLEVLGPTRLRVVAMSDGPEFSGVVRLSLPDGWSASWESLPVSLPAGGHVSADLSLEPPLTPGCYPVRATLEGLPFEVYDVALLTVPEWDADEPVEVLWVASSPSVVSVEPGESALVRVVVASGAHGDLPVQARLLSPRDSWELAGPFCVRGMLPAQGRLALDFTFAAPSWATPDNWSAVVRVAAGELVRTTAPIRLEVAG